MATTALFLSFPAPARADDWSGVAAYGIVVMVTYLASGYSAVVLIALAVKGFRSRTALYVSFVLSTITSLAVLCALLAAWQYKAWDEQAALWMLALDGAAVIFAWVAPTAQFRFLGRPDISQKS